MEYSELDHLRDKEQIVSDIYEKLLEELHKFGQRTSQIRTIKN